MAGSTLLPWQAGLWLAGCLERLAPYVRSHATPRAARCFRDGVDAFWTGHGELTATDAARIAALAAKVADQHDELSPLAHAFDLLARSAVAAGHPTAGPMEEIAGWMVHPWAELGRREDAWGEREARAQRDTLPMTGQPPARAAAQIRIVSARLGAGWAALLDPPRRGPSATEVVVPPADLTHRVGDVVAVSCPWTPAVATGRDEDHAFVRWPWTRAGREVVVALPVDESGAWWPYQLRPPASQLGEGVPCAVGIPAARCYVVRSGRLDPPDVTESVALLPAGSGWAKAADVRLGGDEPIEVRLLHRAYAALHPGDGVDDADGRRLRFVPPFGFFAAARRTAPKWPLTLVARDGVAPPPAAVAAVSRSTSGTGGHRGEVERWLAAGAVPYPVDVAEELFDDT